MRHRATRRRTAIRPFAMRSSAVAVCTVLFGAEAIAQQESTTLPAVDVKASQYDADDVRPEGVTTATKTYLAPKDIPQTMDTLEVNKYKSYGINDLSIMLDGIPGVSTNYGMRGEGVMIRGFSADSGDIYRDGVRESGQVRRSTANVERNPAELRLAADQQQDHVEHAGPDRQVQDRQRGARPAGGPEASKELRRPKVYGTVPGTFTYDPRNPNTSAWPDRPARVAPTQNNRRKGEAEALYVQDLISLTPQWKLLAGLRRDRFKFHSTNDVSGLPAGYATSRGRDAALIGIGMRLSTTTLKAWSRRSCPCAAAAASSCVCRSGSASVTVRPVRRQTSRTARASKPSGLMP